MTYEFDTRHDAIRSLDIRISDLKNSATLATASKNFDRIIQLDAERTVLCISIVRDVFPDYVVGTCMMRDDDDLPPYEWRVITVTPAGMTWEEADDANLLWGSGETEERAWMDLYDEWVSSFLI